MNPEVLRKLPKPKLADLLGLAGDILKGQVRGRLVVEVKS